MKMKQGSSAGKTSQKEHQSDMDEKKRSVSIRADLRPAYYDDFHCLAAGCSTTAYIA